MASNSQELSLLNMNSLVDENNPQEVGLFAQRQSILDSEDFVMLKDTLRRLAMMYKGFSPLTPKILNAEYKKLEESDCQGIPFKKALFDDLVTFLLYLPHHIEFCGKPSLDCRIKAVVPKNLQHLAEFFEKDRANRIPGYDPSGNRIFFLEYDKQWEVVEYVLKHPLGVPYEDIEDKFMRPFQLYEQYEMSHCEHFLHFMKHTDLFGQRGMVFHQIYFNEKRTKHMYLNSDGTLNEEVLSVLKSNGIAI
uniref:Uncharacterized protein n=1 Tax=Cacopsylla melanoneura TaxID=428564 RepID=A0A8D8V1C1_9HEMI